MARRIQDDSNIASDQYITGAAYVQDQLQTKDDGSDPPKKGTPLVASWMGDIYQFFMKAMDDAGLAFNTVEDNENNGYQYITAIVSKITSVIRNTQATEALRGAAKIATQAQVNAGTDGETIVSPLKLEAYVGGILKRDVNSGTTTLVEQSESTISTTQAISRGGVVILKVDAVVSGQFTGDVTIIVTIRRDREGTVTLAKSRAQFFKGDSSPRFYTISYFHAELFPQEGDKFILLVEKTGGTATVTDALIMTS